MTDRLTDTEDAEITGKSRRTMIREYALAMRRRGLTRGTIDARTSCVRRWFEHLKGRPATRELLEDWLDGRNLSARTRYGNVSHLHMFYLWAQREGYCTDDPTMLVERPRLPRRLPRPAKHAGVAFAITVATPQTALMLVLMVDAGLRCCEVATLDWADVDLQRRVLMVTGKGGHDRVIGIPDRLGAHLEPAGTAGPVIGRRLSACRVSQIVNQHLRECGVSSTAHQLRHLYATRMLAATHDLTQVQQALGHMSITSTQIYAQVDGARAIDAGRALR